MAEVRYVGACTHFHSKPFATEAQARRWCAQVEHMGNCQELHQVIEVRPDERGVYRYPDGRMVES
jgi:hypothetical protein